MGSVTRIVIVEDDDGIRSAMAELLRDEGYDVVETANGAEALATLRAGADPCAMLLDLMMPIMNGWKLLGVMDSDAGLTQIPVIVVTAAPENSPAVSAVRRVLRKPVRVDELLGAVREHCGNPRSGDDRRGAQAPRWG